MIDILASLDVAVFALVNGVLSTPVGDVVWPAVTDYDKQWPVRIVLLLVWVLLIVKGGRRGRTVAFLILPVILCADQLSSFVLKSWFQRPRPCHLVGGVPAIPRVHLLVHCGGGTSFPSSHAVNNFAVALTFAWFYRRYAWAFLLWAATIAISRVAVGVHYPSDVLGGALIGIAVAAAILTVWLSLERILPAPLGLKPSRGRER